MGNQQGKTNQYQQYYDALHGNASASTSTTSATNIFANMTPPAEATADTVDPYEVLGVSKQFTWDELKISYHRIARIVHPDKGGNEKLFNLVTECFRKLAYEYKLRQEQPHHHELKKSSQRYHESQEHMREQPHVFEHRFGMQMNGTTPPPPQNTSLTGTGSGTNDFSLPSNGNFQERFNKIFDEFKLEDETSRGYAHMMAPSSKTREDINIDRRVKKFTNEAFNEEFNRLPTRQQVVKYKEPEALVLTKNIAYTEIGDKKEDFTHADPTAKTGLFYTDYMQAYDEGNQRLVDPNSVKRKEFKTIEEYDAYRAKRTTRQLTQKELQYRAQQKQLEEEKEQQRLERIRMQDEQQRIQYERVQQLMLRR